MKKTMKTADAERREEKRDWIVAAIVVAAIIAILVLFNKPFANFVVRAMENQSVLTHHTGD